MDASPLLRTLEQLNDTAWADTLHPKLKDGGSAGNLALACKQLRQLCHGTQTKLRLAGSDCSYESALAQIPEHFPSCTDVTLKIESCEDASVHLSAVLPVLARLQRPVKLALRVTDNEASHPSYMAPVLAMVHLLLPGLQCLELSVSASWDDSNWAWRVLGRATQLTSLAVAFDAAVDEPASLGHLSALSSLSSLSSLATLTLRANGLKLQQDYSWLQHLTGLTRLYLPLVEQQQGMASIGSCTNLRDLALAVRGDAALSETEHASIAQLVQLTRLSIRRATAGSNPNLLSALGVLSQLESLALDGLSPTLLPGLAALSKLTELQGTWQADDVASGTHAVCDGVVELHGSGPVPFAAFPQLRTCTQWATWDPTTLKALAENCKQLKALTIWKGMTAASLSSSTCVGERTAAIQALASLEHLTMLEFSVNHNAEATALAATTQLKHLCVLVRAGCTCTGLQVLIQLRGLQSLSLDLRGLTRLQEQDAQSVLCGMRHVGHLSIYAPDHQLDRFKAALKAAHAARLAVPAHVTLDVLPKV